MEIRTPGALSGPLLLLLACGACTTSVTQMQRARTLDPGQIEASLGASLPVHSRFFSELIDTEEKIRARLGSAEASGKPITTEEQRQALETALAFVLFGPGLLPEINARYGITSGLDVGLRYAGPLLRADLKVQPMTAAEVGLDLAVDVGLARHSDTGPSAFDQIRDLSTYVKLGDYSRYDVDLGLLAGREFGDWGAVYGGARYVVSFIEIDEDLAIVEVASGLPHTELSARMHQFGGTLGGRVGYRYLFLAAEMTVMRVLYEPTILGSPTDLGGWTLAPALALVGLW
jgi:hypothetical protein